MADQSPPSLAARLPIILVLLFIFYLGLSGTMIAVTNNGFGPIFELFIPSNGITPKPLIPGSPAPIPNKFTHIPVVDEALAILVVFFACFIDGSPTPVAFLGYWATMMQMNAAWALVVMEGMRVASTDRARKGFGGARVLSWTTVIGLIMQNITFAVTTPLWLVAHVLVAPIRTAEDLLVKDVKALEALPWASLLGFVVPFLAMALPAPDVLSHTARYGFIAFWQLFPLWMALLIPVLRMFNTASSQTMTSAKVYKIVIAYCTVLNLPILVLSFVPSAIADFLPDSLRQFTSVLWKDVFLPSLPWDMPTLSVSPTEFLANGLASDVTPSFVHYFLQWDWLAGTTALLAWSVYMYVCAGGRDWLKLAKTVVPIGILGGPVAATAATLWQRDDVLFSVADKKVA